MNNQRLNYFTFQYGNKYKNIYYMGDCQSMSEEQIQENENFTMVKYLSQGSIIEYNNKEYTITKIDTGTKFTTLRLVSGRIKQKIEIENEKRVKVVEQEEEENVTTAPLAVKCFYWGVDYRTPSLLFELTIGTDQKQIKTDIEQLIETTKKNSIKISEENYNEIYSIQNGNFKFSYSDSYDKVELVISGPKKLILPLRPYCIKKNEIFKQNIEKKKEEIEIQKAITFLESKGFKVTKK